MDLRESERALAPAERWQRIIETATAAAGLEARADEADDDVDEYWLEYDEQVERLVALIAAPEAEGMWAAVSRHLATGAGAS